MEMIDINKGWQDVECVGEISSNILKTESFFKKRNWKFVIKLKCTFIWLRNTTLWYLPKRNRNIFHVSNLTASAFINN